MNRNKSGFFDKTNKVDKSSARPAKKRETIQIIKTRNEIGGQYYWPYQNKKDYKWIVWITMSTN